MENKEEILRRGIALSVTPHGVPALPEGRVAPAPPVAGEAGHKRVPRSVCNAAAPSARRTQGTANGEPSSDPYMAQEMPVGTEQLRQFMQVLLSYKAGKAATERRILDSENWWKLRNQPARAEKGFHSRSGWLHNVIVSKHADAIEAYPEPNILPREKNDAPEAQKLSAIVPCVLEQNDFEAIYSDVAWQKLKTGTGVYKVMWDSTRHGGLGDIAISRVNLLNLYWEPGITDIQRSRYVFHTELCDKELLVAEFPQLAGKLEANSFLSTRFLYDDAVDCSDKATVIEVYYRKGYALHYCKFVGEQVLYATENDPLFAARGLYDHGQYPYVFDVLFPIEGSPCGYGFVDLCRNPQTEIDMLNTSFLKNVRAGATPRYFSRQDGNINEEECLDMDKTVVHVSGNVDEASVRRIEHNALDGNYIHVLESTINELRQTSGNTEAGTGAVSSGVTAASAIAALQEASGKGSRDATLTAYRAYSRLVALCIELIRQFYDLPRQFRITGETGAPDYITYTNHGLKPQHQGVAFGQDLGYRKPVFDIKIVPQKKNSYTKVAQNELALQLLKLGFFNPQLADQALLCLEMMDFDGKDTVMGRIRAQQEDAQKLQKYMALALQLAQEADPALAQRIAAEMQQSGAAPKITGDTKLFSAGAKEASHMTKARESARSVSQPKGGRR